MLGLNEDTGATIKHMAWRMLRESEAARKEAADRARQILVKLPSCRGLVRDVINDTKLKYPRMTPERLRSHAYGHAMHSHSAIPRGLPCGADDAAGYERDESALVAGIYLVAAALLELEMCQRADGSETRRGWARIGEME